MNDRREFLTAGAAGLAAALLAAHEAQAAPSARTIAQRDAPKVSLDGWQMTASEVNYPPGESSARHRHPGFVIGYVLEGQYRFAVNEQAPYCRQDKCSSSRSTRQARCMRCLATQAQRNRRRSSRLCSRRKATRSRFPIDASTGSDLLVRPSDGGIDRASGLRN